MSNFRRKWMPQIETRQALSHSVRFIHRSPPSIEFSIPIGELLNRSSRHIHGRCQFLSWELISISLFCPTPLSKVEFSPVMKNNPELSTNNVFRGWLDPLQNLFYREWRTKWGFLWFQPLRKRQMSRHSYTLTPLLVSFSSKILLGASRSMTSYWMLLLNMISNEGKLRLVLESRHTTHEMETSACFSRN